MRKVEDKFINYWSGGDRGDRGGRWDRGDRDDGGWR